ncbi:MAG TPA: radical SAM protein [Candidatus Eisenbacteria bacterium]|jgi:wyosine [tRNA(Phe)-imidazoG37] synthetase (radical SAM superfamily)
MLLPPQRGITYGPVRSRRLGRSLGVNILPAGRKVCNFDCRYCQYGWTDRAYLEAVTDADFPPVPDILEAVAATLRTLPQPPHYITFSGNGEPTLHPRFGEVVEGVNGVRDRLAAGVGTAILSNSSRVALPEIRAALGRLDLRIMKLDAGSEACFRRYNRPLGGITLESVVEGLRALPDVTLQTLITAGPAGNLVESEIEAWVERVASIRPRAVQLYTLDREPPDRDLLPASPEQLDGVRGRVEALGIRAEVF